jgi:hypothetical protein
MAATPTVIFRRNREAIKSRVAEKKAEDAAYRQQFIDAAAAEKSASESKPVAPAPREDRQIQQTNQRQQQHQGNRR